MFGRGLRVADIVSGLPVVVGIWHCPEKSIAHGTVHAVRSGAGLALPLTVTPRPSRQSNEPVGIHRCRPH
jgi:hypothetical protein